MATENAAFDELVAEYLLAAQQNDMRSDEYWLERAGADAALMLDFLRDHHGFRSMVGTVARVAPIVSSGVPAPDRSGAKPFVGDYELLEEIARGGMGIVFRARHRLLRREVALKMILAGPWAGSEDIARFRAEAQAAARFDHIGIVPIYEFGQHDGCYYYTMALIDGPSLAEHIRQGPVAPRQAASIIRRVAEGVAHAHAKGVVHRDLKPANVLLARRIGGPDSALSPSPRSSSSAGGDYLPFDPRVSDFGLAKRFVGDAGLTATGQTVGTPSYMSPEQAQGRMVDVGVASDVYSLGAVLYELLTGRPPFRADTPLETLRQVCDSLPAPPRLLNAAIPVDLETICLRCLEKDPRQRYGSAQAVADDLGRFLAGDAIEARSVNLVQRVTRALGQRRHTEEFEGWGRAAALAGVIVLATHLAIFGLDSQPVSRLVSYWIPKSLMFLMLLLTLAYYRRHALLPANAAERLVWALWGALFSGLVSASIFVWAAGIPHHHSFALSAMFGGFCFFVIGSHLWGGCYALGGLFFAAAPWLAMYPRAAAIGDGLLWCGALCTLGVHYWPRPATCQTPPLHPTTAHPTSAHPITAPPSALPPTASQSAFPDHS
jgi:serine/threonine protein kinase